jgi:hypothetical protein
LPIDLSSVPGTITALAIDGKGANVLIAAASDRGAVYLASADKPIRAIGDFGSPSALALSRNDQDVVVADTATNQITIVRNFAGTPEAEWIAGERDGVSRPVGLAVTPDGRSLYIANASTRTLDVWSLEAQAIDKSLPLDAEPTRLSSFASSSMFVLNDVGNHPLLLLEAGMIPAVYFVPAEGSNSDETTSAICHLQYRPRCRFDGTGRRRQRFPIQLHTAIRQPGGDSAGRHHQFSGYYGQSRESQPKPDNVRHIRHRKSRTVARNRE